jgi:hypothetical protein
VAGNYIYVRQISTALLILWFAPATSASVPVGGGALTSLSDNTAYTFPAGTFTETVVITHTARFPGNAPAFGSIIDIGHVFEVTATYGSTGQSAQPTQPYTVTVQYTDVEKGPAIENTLALYWWNGSQWVKEDSSVVNAVTNTITARPNHFSLWAVLGETKRVHLPLILRN